MLSYLAVEPRKNEGISRQVALSTASNYAGRILNLGVWFGLTPLILHYLGSTQYGLWALVASFVAYGNLADIGVGAALTKYVAEFRARDDSEMASQLIATSLWMYCVLGFLVIAIFAILAPFVPDLINVPAGQRGTASWLVVITALGVAVQLPATEPPEEPADPHPRSTEAAASSVRTPGTRTPVVSLFMDHALVDDD